MEFEGMSEAERLDYNLAQIHLYRFMVRRGVVKTIEEYTERFAPIFEMLADGNLEVNDVDWKQQQKQIEAIQNQVRRSSER